jgi:thiamine monophosphate synthase
VNATRLLLLTDRSQLHLGRSLRRTLLECVEAGATHIVIRELDEEPAAREALAAALVAAGATVIAAHSPLPSASGVHLPACNAQFSELPPPSGTAEVSRTARYTLFGRSCHSAAEVRAAAAEGAAYATLSPYALTASKPGYGPALPPEEYAAAAAALPVYALGGITPGNAADAIAAGAHGVAVMGEVMRADDPAAVVAALLGALAGSAAAGVA